MVRKGAVGVRRGTVGIDRWNLCSDAALNGMNSTVESGQNKNDYGRTK